MTMNQDIKQEALEASPRQKTYNCDICNKVFANFKYFKRHIVVHSESKSFQCKYCDKTFTKSNALSVHLRTHTGNNSYTHANIFSYISVAPFCR